MSEAASKKTGCGRVILLVGGGLLAAFVGLIVLAFVVDEINLSKMTPSQRAKFVAERDAKYEKARAERQAKEQIEKAARDAKDPDKMSPALQSVLKRLGKEKTLEAGKEVSALLTSYNLTLTETHYRDFDEILLRASYLDGASLDGVLECLVANKAMADKQGLTLGQASGLCATSTSIPTFNVRLTTYAPACHYISDVDKAITLWQSGNDELIAQQTSCRFLEKGTRAVDLDSAGYSQQILLVDNDGRLIELWTMASVLSWK